MCGGAQTPFVILHKLGFCRALEAVNPALPTSGESTMNKFSKYLSALFLAVTLASVVGCASTSKQEGTGEYVDDSVITTKVKAAILGEPSLKVAEINVETFKGVVQLSGFVTSTALANKAVEIAGKVSGVKSVKNDMRVK
jgi:osmotically-inducible protein OsmY